ncbi:MAG: sigma-70 family RNA polymerase sigma factor [Verrucomicrobiota bacterium]
METSADDWIRQAVNDHSGLLTQYAYQLLKDWDRARDAVQETFLKLCDQRREVVMPKLKPWLYTVCRNQSLDYIRKESRMTEIDFMDELPSHEPSPMRPMELREEKSILLQALSQLTPQQREVVRLKFLTNLSYKEISEITGMNENLIGVLIHKGLKNLRSRMTEQLQSEAPSS